VGDVAVATLRGRFIEASVIDKAFAQLYERLDAQASQRVVLNLGEVSFAASMMFGKLIQLHRKIIQRGGSLVLCSLNHSAVREVFRINKLDKFFIIADGLGEAVAAFSPLVTTCPVHGCGGTMRGVGSVQYEPKVDTKLSCLDCGAEVRARPFEGPSSATSSLRVQVLSAPTYDHECVHIISPGVLAKSGIAEVYQLEIAGRLDLFSYEVAQNLWLTLPLPRRALIGLWDVSEVTPDGATAIDSLCHDARDRMVMVGQADKPETQGFALSRRISATVEAAVQELGEVPSGSRSPIVLSVRKSGA